MGIENNERGASMKNRNLFFTFIIAIFLIVSGCASTQTVKNAQGTGEKKEYAQPIEVMWSLVSKAVIETGGEIKEKNDTEKYLTASYGASAWSWGETVGVFCKKYENGTIIEVISQANLKTNITAVKRAPQLFEYLDTNVPK